jgi:hypothetical protein
LNNESAELAIELPEGDKIGLIDAKGLLAGDDCGVVEGY